MNNWIFLAIIAAFLYALRIITVGEMTALGFNGLYYYSVGQAFFSTAYFIYRKEWTRRNNPLDINDPEKRKVLTRTWGNKFDFGILAYGCFSAFIQMVFYYSVVLAARASRLSGLNLGITTAIWSFVPFFVAIIERIVYGVGVKPSQILGMVLLVLMSILISLSDLFDSHNDGTVVIVGDHMPLYKAVLYSMVYPVVATSGTFIVKYANNTLRISSLDFAMTFSFLYSWIFFILGFFQWITRRVDFTWKHFMQGTVVGCCTVIAAAVSIMAINTEGAPAGPVVAVMSSQILISLIADCIIQLQAPAFLQWIGFIIGIIGTLVLSIPDQMLSLWRYLRHKKDSQ